MTWAAKAKVFSMKNTTSAPTGVITLCAKKADKKKSSDAKFDFFDYLEIKLLSKNKLLHEISFESKLAQTKHMKQTLKSAKPQKTCTRNRKAARLFRATQITSTRPVKQSSAWRLSGSTYVERERKDR